MKRLLLVLAVAALVLVSVARLAPWGGDRSLAIPGGVVESGAIEARTDDVSPVELVAPGASSDARSGADAVSGDPTAGDDPESPDVHVEQVELACLISGIVVDGGGVGVPGADVHVARHVADTGGIGMRTVRIQQLSPLTTVTGPDGRFEVRGEAAGEVVVRAEKSEHALREEVTCTIPESGVTLVLERSGSVLVTVTPDSVDLAELVYVEVREPEREHDVAGSVGAFRDLRSLRAGLSPGIYDVVIVGRRNRSALVTAARVQVRSGDSTRDPRLIDLDLTAVLRKVRVTVVDRDERLLDATVWVHSGSSSRGERTGEDGWVEFVAGVEGVDVAVREPGWREVRRRGVTEDIVFQLDRPLRVRLVRADGRSAQLGDLYVMMTPSARGGDPPTGEDEADVTLKGNDNAVEVDLHRPGTYELRWAVSMAHGLGGTSFLHPDDLEPQVVVIEETDVLQEIVLTFDPTQLAAMRERADRTRAELVRLPEETDSEYQRRIFDVITRKNR